MQLLTVKMFDGQLPYTNAVIDSQNVLTVNNHACLIQLFTVKMIEIHYQNAHFFLHIPSIQGHKPKSINFYSLQYYQLSVLWSNKLQPSLKTLSQQLTWAILCWNISLRTLCFIGTHPWCRKHYFLLLPWIKVAIGLMALAIILS